MMVCRRHFYSVILVLLFVNGTPHEVFTQSQLSRDGNRDLLLTAGVLTVASAASFTLDVAADGKFGSDRYTHTFAAKSGRYTRAYFQLGIPLLTAGSGAIFRDDNLFQASYHAFLASTAVFLTTGTVKFIAGRRRPYIADSPFEFTGFSLKEEERSFFSGHCAVAFSLAAVYSARYSDRVAVSIASYSAAGFIAVSRILSDEHWFSDVFTGAAFGFTAGKLIARALQDDRLEVFPFSGAQNSMGLGMIYRF